MNFAERYRHERRIVILILAIFLCFNFLTEKSALAEKTGKRQFFSVGTAPPGGAFFVVGGRHCPSRQRQRRRFKLGGRRGSYERHARKHPASRKG